VALELLLTVYNTFIWVLLAVFVVKRMKSLSLCTHPATTPYMRTMPHVRYVLQFRHEYLSLFEAMKSPPFCTQPGESPVSSSRRITCSTGGHKLHNLAVSAVQ
jgi:hypothetical protein